MVKVLFIINSSKKATSITIEALALAKASHKLEAKELHTTEEGHACQLAKQEALSTDVIVAVGGDGTCNEVIQGIIESGVVDPSFGIIPNGTGNDFSKMLPPFNPQQFIEALEKNRGNTIDVGAAYFGNGIRYFLNINDIGFGAKVVQIMNAQRKNKLGGKISYSLAIIRAFFSYKKSSIRIKGDDFSFEGRFLLIAFCNGKIFGHGLTISPDAKLRSGKLAITVVGDISLMTYIRKLGDLKRGRKIEHPEAHYFVSTKIEIQEMKSSVFSEGDGELFGSGLQVVEILKDRIKLLY